VFGAPGRSAKLLPPTDPYGTVIRTELEARLAEGADRRISVVYAGAGFGKSTLAARTAGTRRSAWYTLDGSDRHLGTLAAGVAAALRSRIPELAAGLTGPVEGSIEAATEDEALTRGQAAAALIADAVQDRLGSGLLLVLDDLHAIDGEPAAWRFIEALVRLAPPELHFLVTTRTELPFGVERLRGQGQVLDLGGAALAFSVEEIGVLLETLIGERTGAEERTKAARRIHDATGGWPAAVRLAVESYRAAPPAGREAALSRLQRPDGPLFAYLAEEVVSRAEPATRELIRRAVHFDRFTADLCVALGSPDAHRRLAELARRALFLQTHPQGEGWYTLHGLIREYTLASMSLDAGEIREVHRAAAAWFESQGILEAALESLGRAGDDEPLAAFLDRHAPRLVIGGAARPVVEAAARLPAELRSARLERACGEGYLARGDWRAAYAAFERAAGKTGALDAGTAWRMGLVHGLRGAYGEALAIYDRAVVEESSAADQALLAAWIASAHYHRGDAEASRIAADRSIALALTADDDRALAAARTALGMSHELAHEPARASAEFAAALDAAERAGDMLQIVRIRNARGALELQAGRFEEALGILDDAVRLADTVGFAAFHARALVNRGHAKQGVGRFEEALADFTAARDIYERIGSPSVAYALVREGSLHMLRGDGFLARSSYESAVRAARDAHDAQALGPALIGLAQTIALDDPDEARRLVDQALELAREVDPVSVLIGAARTRLLLGERAAAAADAAQVISLASTRRDEPGRAAGHELLAECVDDPVVARRHVEDAAAIWQASPAPFGVARNRLVFARVVGGADGRAAAVEAERAFRSLGARGRALEAAALIERIDRSARPPVTIQSLGRFRVLRDGEVVPASAWQSKKARDLLKILVSRRGRPTTRDTFFELLWPDDDPEPLANRLSVALATVRSVLDPDKAFPPEHFLVADKSSIALDLDHVDLDVERFLAETAEAARAERAGQTLAAREHRERAESLYGGDFLEEDPYEDWAVGLREEAQASYIAIARSLAAAAASDGDADGATRFYLRILERDPFDEGAHLGLVQALLIAGRHGEARRRYGFYAARMEEIAVEAAPFPRVSRAGADGRRTPGPAEAAATRA
jgi:ATP/maltotriose-dependent transcriptional regulator MalT/DNA-binding SARP family transcriptional activator